jgi:hypothetical protein
LPTYRFIGAYPRFYPSEFDSDGKSLMAADGTVHDWAKTPDDGQWVLVEDAPAAGPAPEAPPAGPEPAAVAVEPEPAADVAPSDPGPAPAVSEPTPEPVAAPEVPAPVEVPELVPIPEVQAAPVSPAQGFALGRSPFARI